MDMFKDRLDNFVAEYVPVKSNLRWLFNPFDKPIVCWNLCCFVIVLYTMIIVPYFAWFEEYDEGFVSIEALISALYFADIIL